MAARETRSTISPTCSPASPTIWHPRIAELLPWNWQPLDTTRAAA
jgi:hypothetical protein